MNYLSMSGVLVLKAGAEGSSGAGAGLRYDVAEIPAYAGFDPTGRYE
jgi:hypothetical protein